MKFIFHSLRSSSSQNLPYGCASDFEINRRGDHRSPVLQTRNFFRRNVGQGRFPLQGKCHEVTKGFAESQICSCRKYFNKLQFEKWLERSVQATFGTFRLLLGGVNCAKHKRHVAPNSRVNLGETVQCTVS